MKRALVLTALIVAGITRSVFAQVPAIQWAWCYGGSGTENARAMRQTTDGGFVIVGNSDSDDGDVSNKYGATDCWIVKLNGSGDTLWTRVLGGTQQEYATAVDATADGGCIVTAQSRSADGDFTGGSTSNYKCWIIKLDAAGAIQWKKRFGGSAGDTPRDIRQTSDNGYIVASISSSNNGPVWGNHGGVDYWILKLNSAGDTLWSRCYGGTGDDQAFSVQQTSDNGYIVAGQSNSKNGNVSGNHGKWDFWVLKLNASGDTLWTKPLGGTQDDYGNVVQQTADGGYIVGGCSQSNDGDVSGHHGDSTKADIWLVKLSSGGAIQWQKSLGGSQHEALYVDLLSFSLQQTTDGGYVVGTHSQSSDGDVTVNNGGYDAWIVKLTGTGAIDWQKSLGGTGTDRAFSVRQTTGGGYVVAGLAGTNGGDVSGNHGGGDFWVIRLADPTGVLYKMASSRFQLYPNPANSEVTISTILIGAHLVIEDLSGNVLHRAIIRDEKTVFSTAAFANGVYLFKIEEGGMAACQKLRVSR